MKLSMSWAWCSSTSADQRATSARPWAHSCSTSSEEVGALVMKLHFIRNGFFQCETQLSCIQHPHERVLALTETGLQWIHEKFKVTLDIISVCNWEITFTSSLLSGFRLLDFFLFHRSVHATSHNTDQRFGLVWTGYCLSISILLEGLNWSLSDESVILSK